MADNVAITAGTGTTVATDERTIAAVAVNMLCYVLVEM